MRQAGRSLPEYRAARGAGSILDAIARPELVAELTRQPVDRYGTDAAILFSDIVVPVAAIGFGVDVAPGTGPVVAEPFRSKDDLQRLRPLEPETDTRYVIDAVRILADGLDVPLIGFAGGPFTVASYLVEGGPSKNFTRIKALMLGRTGRSGTTWSSGSPTWPWPRCGPSSTPARRRSRSSTAGPGSSPRATTRSWSCPRPPGCSPNWPSPTPASPPSCSAWAPASCCPRWPPPGAPWSGSTGGCRWTRPGGGSGPEWPSRATSTRPCA